MTVGKWPSRTWILLLAGVVLLRLTILKPQWVEKYYASGFYPYSSRFMRFLTAWIPFSVGDLLYVLAGIWLIRELVRWVRLVRRKELSWKITSIVISNYIQVFLCIYLIFNLLWGLNYNRIGVGRQMGLDTQNYSDSLLTSLTTALVHKTNQYRPANPATKFDRASDLAEQAYSRVALSHPFLTVSPHSVKPSLFGIIGNYLGYSGYYNPFTGEGQVNTKVPGFLIPFVTCHEIAHQAGYAKENEANFVGFLAARESQDSAMRYSTYLNMFLYANNELRQVDSTLARKNMDALGAGTKKDLETYRQWLKAYDTPVGDFIDVLYNQYLKLNEQPAGRRSYNQVVSWLLAYYHQQGTI